MFLLSILLLAFSLSMDNLAVAVAYGCCAGSKPFSRHLVWKMSGGFTLAHGLMFSGGWWLGHGLSRWMGRVGYWVAFVILCFLGIRMIREAFAASSSVSVENESWFTLLGLALATSLDAWLVGFGLCFTDIPMGGMVSVLMGCVWLSSVIGFYVGAWLGQALGKHMEALGGVVLVGLGVKLLLEGLGIW